MAHISWVVHEVTRKWNVYELLLVDSNSKAAISFSEENLKHLLGGGVKLDFVPNLFDSKICDSIDSKGQKIFEKFDEN